jgi:acetyl esterase
MIAMVLAKLREANTPALSAGTPGEARALIAAGRAALGRGPAMRIRQEVVVPTRAGTIRARLLIPPQEVVGLCLYLHGGGWVAGTPDDYETLGRTIASRSGCAVLLPDYRLAPEHRFPAGLEDSEDALLWAWRERSALVGADLPIVLAGDSAGANLAIAVQRRLAGKLEIAGQALIYPVAGADFDTQSYQRFATGLPLSRADMQWFFRHYAPSDQWGDPDISPLHATGLAHSPSAVVILAEHDVLHDEGKAYACKLAEAGRLVALRRYHGVPHGFIRLHNLVDTADMAVTALAEDMARFCRR